MSIFQNIIRTGGFMQSEAEFARSRDKVCISGGAGVLRIGMVLGEITATGKYVPSPATAIDGSQIAVAVLYDEVDATDGDVVAPVIAGDAELRAEDIVYDPSVTTLLQMMNKWAQLAAVGVQIRWDAYLNDVQVNEDE